MRAVTVVSGVPRSGTSLVMQMLRAGGMPVLTDEERPPDPDNPRGYLEYAPVRGLGKPGADTRWLAQAEGGALKVIHALLPCLPLGNAYRVLFVHRELDEVIASQDAMLARRGEPVPALGRERIAAVFEAQCEAALAWARGAPDTLAIELQHAELLAAPAASARTIAEFLERDLDLEAMAAAVAPALHRQHGGGGV